MTAGGRTPRIVYLVTTSGVGGAEQQVRALALAFRRRNWAVTVVSMLPLAPLFAGLGDEGVTVVSLGMRRGVPDPRALARFASLLRRSRPDVLHAHMLHASLLARLSRLLVRIPVLVSTMHTQDEGAQWRYLAYRVTDRLSDVTTAVSRVAADEAVRRGAVDRRRLLVVPNGIAVDRFLPDLAARTEKRRELGLGDEFVWLAVGSLHAPKAYPDMIEAMRSVTSSGRRATLLVAGAGPDEAAIRSRIVEAGLGGAVRLLGLRRDVPALLQAADAFVMSSAWEGLPIALLEASATALPVVVTDVGGTTEAVIDGVTGYVVPPREPATLAAAMTRLMDLPAADCRRMGEAARDHAIRSFDLEAVADRWEQLYREHLARNAR